MSQNDDEIILSGADLEPYKVTPTATCWWCQSPGPLTSEHKFKLADLKRMGQGSGAHLWGNGEVTKLIKSARKSPEVRFRPNLCAECNNARSQPFDRAYQIFSDFAWDRQEELESSTRIDMRKIYGANWREESLNLARYIVKHAGCRMDHEGYPVPSPFKPFLNGAATLDSTGLFLVKNPVTYEVLMRGAELGADLREINIGPADGLVSPSRGKLTGYQSVLSVGHFGIYYQWDEDVPMFDSFFRHRWPEVFVYTPRSTRA